MRWIERATVWGLLAVTLAVSGLRSAEDKRVAIYAPRVSFTLPVQDSPAGEYVGLFEALEPLGEVSARAGDKDWRLRFNNIECVFTAGQSAGRIGRHKIDLGAPFVRDGEHGYIPLHSLPAVLSRLLEVRVDFHSGPRRIFVDHAATHFTMENRKGEGMVLSFSEPVNPTLSTEPGKLRMSFTHEPIVSDTGTFQFMDDKLIPAVHFTEANGAAELTVQTSAPVLASFADGGKTIRIVPAPQQSGQASTPTSPAPSTAPAGAPPMPDVGVSGTAGLPAPPQPVTAPPASGPPSYLVVVDAGHGGDERGAALSDKLAEKDVTLALARKLRSELQARGISTLMLRDSDVTLSLEQRADTVNASRAAVYVALHAANLGTAVRVYTAMLPAVTARQPLFVPWETAQAGHTLGSRVVANAVAHEIGKRDMPSAVVAAPVRPLNNVATSAIAVEVSLPGPQVDALNSANYQQQVAAAVAAGIADARPQVEAAR